MHSFKLGLTDSYFQITAKRHSSVCCCSCSCSCSSSSSSSSNQLVVVEFICLNVCVCCWLGFIWGGCCLLFWGRCFWGVVGFLII